MRDTARLIYTLVVLFVGGIPTSLVVAQSPTPPVSQHATGRGMRWVPMTGGTPSLKAGGAPAGGVHPGGLPPSGAGLSVDSLNMTGIGNDVAVCAQGCSSGAYHQGTVPYYSLDVARNVTLLYNSELAVPRPIFFVDVHIDPSSTKTLVEYDVQATLNGATLTFLNGDTKLRFSAPSPQTTEVRLAGQFDTRSDPAQLDSLTLTITAVWSDATTQQAVYGGDFLNSNGIGSTIGRGWLVGGVQALLVQTNGDIMMNNGDGSAGWFAPNGGGTYLTEMDRDFSILTSTGSGSGIIYTRTYPDSSRVYFDYHGNELGAISSQQDTMLFGYDSVNHLTKIYDPYRTYSGGASRSYITLHYTAGGYLDQITEPGGDGTPGAGRVTHVTIATGDSTLAAIKDPDGDSTRFVYNSNKVLATVIDRRGDTTRYAYDTHSWLVDSIVAPRVPIDAGGGSTTLQTPVTTVSPWQTLGIPTSSTTTTPASPVLTSAIEGTLLDPLGRSTTYTVDLDGAPLSVTGPLSQTVTISRDGLWTELPVKVTYPTGGVDTMQFTANTPNLIYDKPAGDSASNVLYGVNGQADSVWTQGALAFHAFLHAGTGLADSVRVGGTDSLLTKYTYDAQRRMLTVRDVNGHITTFAYDPTFGSVDSAVSPGGLLHIRRFDAFGRDTADFVTGTTYWVCTQYDTLNRVVKMWHRSVSSDTTTATYDALFATRVKTPGGSVYKMTMNAVGWPTASYGGVDTTAFMSYRYDPSGRLTSWTNRRGQRVDMVYDSLDRIIRQSGTNIPTDTFTYSPTGLIQTMQRGTVSLDSMFVNVGGQPDSLVHHIGGHRYAFLYTYAAYSYGQRLSETITTDAGITFVTQADAWRPGATSFDSVAVSPGTATGSVVWTLNNGGDLTKTTFPVGAAKTDSYTVGHLLTSVSLGSAGAVVHDSLSRSYTLDSLGQVIGEWRLSGTDSVARGFFYDGLGRLLKVPNYSTSGCTVVTDSITGAQYTCATQTLLSTEDSVGYDIAGNRTLSGSSVSTTGNELLTWPASSGTVTYTYDADGNMKTRAHNGVTDSLFWGANNELDSVHSGGYRRRYEYNSAGQPVRRSTNGNVDRLWLWNGDQLIADLDSTGTHRNVQYLYHGGMDQVYAIVTDSGGSPLVRYVQRDPMGNVTGIMRNNTLVQFTRYTAWGLADAQPINALADTNRLGWKGLMYESDSTKLYFARNRWYDPVAGRFVSEDPAGLAGGANVYTFAGNNPVNGMDPFGLASVLIAPTMLPREYSPVVLWRPPPPPPPPVVLPPGVTSTTGTGPGSLQFWLDSALNISTPRPGCSNFEPKDCDAVLTAINALLATPAVQCRLFGNEAQTMLGDNDLGEVANMGTDEYGHPIMGSTYRDPYDPSYVVTSISGLNFASSLPGFSYSFGSFTELQTLYGTLAHEMSHVLFESPDAPASNPQQTTVNGVTTGFGWEQMCYASAGPNLYNLLMNP